MKRTLYNRDEVRAFKKVRNTSLLLDLPTQDWHMDVNQHWDHMRDFLRNKCSMQFPQSKRKQRQEYFSPKTWGTLCHLKDLRIQHRQADFARKLACLKLYFAAWKSSDDDIDLPTLRYHVHFTRQYEASIFEARSSAIQQFRGQKKQDWKEWVQSNLRQQLHSCKGVSSGDLFKILRPKRIIAAKSGKLKRSLPGLCDAHGTWQHSRTQIALSWQKQFASIENASAVSVQTLLSKSKPICQALGPKVLSEIPSLIDLDCALRTLNPNKAPGLDGQG